MLKSRIPHIIERSELIVQGAVEKAAFDIERGAKKRSRVDTGTMRGGWQSHQGGRFEWIVFNPVHYTIYNEYGTIYMSAQPMLRPAIEEVRPGFERDVKMAYQ
jgi:HK97 gp10 family phage protein